MTKCLNLRALSKFQFQTFMNSFDDVLLDFDGVLVHFFKPIPGAKECVNGLQSANKNVCVVSNNDFLRLDEFYQYLLQEGFNIEKENIAFPTLALISHFQELNFDRKIYLIGSNPMREDLFQAGFDVSTRGPSYISQYRIINTVKEELEDDPDIGAVVVDFDVNVNYIRLSKALTYLRRHDVKLLAAISGKKIPIEGGHYMIGIDYILNILTDMSGKSIEYFGKPHKIFQNFVQKQLKLKAPERTLFVGDTLFQDMGFASSCNFQKLLVLSGNTKLEDLDCISDDNLRPDYYANSLSDFSELINKYCV